MTALPVAAWAPRRIAWGVFTALAAELAYSSLFMTA